MRGGVLLVCIRSHCKNYTINGYCPRESPTRNLVKTQQASPLAPGVAAGSESTTGLLRSSAIPRRATRVGLYRHMAPEKRKYYYMVA